MTQLTDYQIERGIAVISMNLAPVNSLGLALRQALMADIARAEHDPEVEAIILTSAQKVFCGGADISEFEAGTFAEQPDLPLVCNTLELTNKIVVAAINGLALGGGCELTLACDYRFAWPQAKLGLPEVHLGILPGAGGTQRLPRLAGVKTALDMITSGRPVDAATLAQNGVVDYLHPQKQTDLTPVIEYTRQLLASGAGKRPSAEIQVEKDNLPSDFFAHYRAAIAPKTRGYYAPERCIDAVEAACTLPLEQGLARENELFMQCLNTPQARAQQHLFFAERKVAKIDDIDAKSTPLRSIKSVAVIGSGTMGGGIAMNFLNVGIPTTLLDLSQEALEKGIGIINKNYQHTVNKGRLSEQQMQQRMALLHSTTDYADLVDVDLVIEAVFENINIKKKVFASLDQHCKPGAILATNTSTLDVDEVAASTSRPQDVIGLHFFSPANVMKLLEIVRGTKTADDVLLSAVKLAQGIKKVPVVSGVCWGFIGNRATEPYLRESMALLLEGATPAQIDRVHTEFGMPMGLPSVIDLAGVDIVIQTREERKAQTIDRDPSYCAVPRKLFELGRLGQKSGRGLFIYEGRAKFDDPEVTELATKLAKQFGIQQREISDQEILERTIYPMINECALILQEGIAQRSSDIDVVLAYGFGFPAYRGGPLQYADEIGLDTVLAGLEKYRHQLVNGETWYQPAPLLQKLVEQGTKFRDYVRNS
ncbi:3-hydroxyacyl-CoA dehydrogenase NAD-binding domain-containing protein [Vibrio sp.]|uniref:3-hydroxyacyl-CoA dehydrogenase NAD-binding domain-containing protein n=1 Tax=Vibrio sp. TaxID=678 RepID=UPI003D0E2103